ncbi:acyl-CoA dehydrogenase family protein [Ralstonia insidiosa]|jgi:alkylation response protein AidB-like acyl-CoA dehydrogenase|uniref:acyl-CoA dehydrogenase family protein n=1 Tax=Ralstonia TaxID=48736 RepID=UPI0006648E2A|nr:acyl-CoA dehydrogenase family protein [Ralstonia insidiosa]KMW48207.1 acyl-CoA dehydrogenase [Ralstonia sp. MD27]MBX3770181.1 acyl-CoA dehydrogenase family protein [Ralstonia pickettii]NOZ14472.1 pimeloyl-CoA dehydrogenase large subunit [Betaproteobacteria bacterium]MBA9854342.1 pimeloyl-CoA dehydrogenase large subunit [Ralstonia insidiosa]MBA9868157.1 pimeloyl-CoA dehydrogenase large subunit [Ralstonia insidiosa]
MDLNYSAADDAFRQEVRGWLQANLPKDIQDKVLNHRRLNREDFVRWHKALAGKGWSVPHWPVEWGGTGWSPIQKHIWDEECAQIGAPGVLPFGVSMVAPVIMKYGNEAQKRYFLPRIVDCTDWWCQGYSEPGSGSDLASVKTRAVREGDHYIVNGQKTWTTLGQHADMIFCLVRTDPDAKKQEGISFLLIDMKTPGITVRPIIMLDEEHEVNEVFFDNVKVPVDNLIGEENRGWTYAKYLLGHERTGIARVGHSKRELAFLKRVALQHQKNGKPLLQDPVFAAKVASLEIELMALEITVLRVVSSENAGKGPGPEASLLKIKGTQIQQMLTELMVEAVGPYAQPFDPSYLEGEHQQAVTGDNDAAPLAPYYFNYRKTSIYGGSNEIQRNIISQMILGV